MIHPYHYKPTAAQKQELADALNRIKAAHARRRADRLAAAPILGALREVVFRPQPLDNPVINNAGAL